MATILSLAIMTGVVAGEEQRIPAFPGAEGAGKYTVGFGRYGTVYRVSNTDNDVVTFDTL